MFASTFNNPDETIVNGSRRVNWCKRQLATVARLFSPRFSFRFDSALIVQQLARPQCTFQRLEKEETRRHRFHKDRSLIRFIHLPLARFNYPRWILGNSLLPRGLSFRISPNRNRTKFSSSFEFPRVSRLRFTAQTRSRSRISPFVVSKRFKLYLFLGRYSRMYPLRGDRVWKKSHSLLVSPNFRKGLSPSL